MEIWEYALLAGIGLVAGIINVIAGGGSLLTLPAMILMGLPESVANGTNRVAILAQNIVAVSAFRRKGFSDFRRSLTLGLCALPGSVAGAWCGAVIRGDLFNLILAIVMVGVVLLSIIRGQRKPARDSPSNPERPPEKSRIILGHLAMVGVGFYGGFIQAGVGFFIMAALHHLMHLGLVRVNMHKVFIVGIFTAVALVVFVLTDNVWWLPGIALALGNSAGGWIGSHLTVTRGETFIRRFFYLALIVMAIRLMLQ